MARQPEYLRSRVVDDTEVAAGDVLDPSSLPKALRGVHTAVYLIHSMGVAHMRTTTPLRTFNADKESS